MILSLEDPRSHDSFPAQTARTSTGW